MSQDNQEIQADAMISVREAYLALYYFVDAYFVRGGRRGDELAMLRADIGPRERAGQVETNDPAFWDDWLDAIRTARTQGFPQDL